MNNFNRLNDVYFKSLFTNERNKQIAICFLNDILGREGKTAQVRQMGSFIFRKMHQRRIGGNSHEHACY